jgi:tripartite-type tricarboxylate transporter receptor subunit TctC
MRNKLGFMLKSVYSMALLAAALIMAAPPALAQPFPSKPVRVVVNFPPGGAADQLGRALGAKLTESMGQPFVVENRPGANGAIGAGEVVKAAADGHTLLMSSGGAITVNGLLMKDLGFDPMSALVPVAPVAVVSVYLVVKPAIPAATLQEFVSHLRANPGRLNYGSPGNGSSPHLAGEMFKSAARVQATHVPYKGAAPALTDLLGGQLDFMFDPGVGLQHVKSGKLRLLAVGSPRRHPAYIEVPTVGEVLGTEFDADTVFGLYAPSGTPKDVVARLNREAARVMGSAELKERTAAIAAQPLALSPEAFAERMRAEHRRMAVLVREAGL